MIDDAVSEKTALRRTMKKKNPAVDTRSEAEKEIDAAIAGSRIKEANDAARKKTFKRGLIAAFVLFICYGAYYLFAPLQGNIGYGVCKVFVEQNVRYPHTLHISSTENFSTSVRIWYAHVDSFGEYKMESAQCFFKIDPAGAVPFLLEKVTLNRRDVDSAIVNNFNRAIGTIFAAPPDLDMPSALPDSLQDLKVDTDKYRKPIFQKSY